MAYVVVLNHNGPIPLRHIVETEGPYDQEEFMAWYYSEYHELEGDEFPYCSSHQQMLECVKTAEGKEC